DEFLTRFTNIADKRTATHTSILQALTLMNGKHMDGLIKNSKSLKTVQDNDNGGPTRNIQEIDLVKLAPQATAAANERMLTYVQSGGPGGDRKAALADIFWALLNSAEFILNH